MRNCGRELSLTANTMSTPQYPFCPDENFAVATLYYGAGFFASESGDFGLQFPAPMAH
jgi:hypothetical protein